MTTVKKVDNERYNRNFYHDSYDDASPDFLTDLLLHGEDNVQTKYVHKNGSIKILEGNENRPRFTVLTFERQTRSYPKTGIHFTVWVMQLLDGSFGIIKAVTDTSLAGWLKGKEMMCGSTLIVPDFRIVRLQSADELSNKMIMLIKDCGWVYPPDVDLPYVGPQEKARPWGQIFDEEENFRAPSRRITHFYHCTIDNNMKYGNLLFTEERRESRQAHRWNSYVRAEVLRSEYSEGNWIMSGDTKKAWVMRMNDKKAAAAKKRDLWVESDDEEKVTECVCMSTFAYKNCIAKQYTVDMMDKDAVILAFSPYCKHPHVMDPGMEWEELSDKTKRWCSYQHYHSNFFRASKGECVPLPWCVEKYIKQCYGGASALYTGFKTKRQRAAERYTGKKAKKITMAEAKSVNKKAFSKSTGKENEISSSDSE